MNISELDEAQGLTAEMVRDKLVALGHPLRECPSFYVCPSLGKHTHHGHSDAVDFIVPDAWTERRQQVVLEAALGLLAAMGGISDQELLRDINPRMRPWPSPESTNANHFWLALDVATTTMVMGRFMPHGRDHRRFEWGSDGDRYILEESDRGILYWPCDPWGNKIRWPEKDGAML